MVTTVSEKVVIESLRDRYNCSVCVANVGDDQVAALKNGLYGSYETYWMFSRNRFSIEEVV